jgi:serine/threonine-protein kinase
MAGQSQDPLIGHLVTGRYRVVKPLGEGGMGQVYLAIHEAIEKQVALKVLKPEYSAKEDIITRFQQEAISASRIKHPNVLEVFDFGTLDNGCAFLAMEFLQGNDVADELMRTGYLETSRALRIMLQVCRALAAAHRAGVVHRDMKPDNIFLLRTADGEEIVKIVDFGIAQLRNTEEEAAKSNNKPQRRLTKTGMIFGTPEYMAPEQAAGKKADQRVDVYACGIILFEMLTGAVPFTGDSFMAVLAAHLNDPAPSMMEFRPDLSISRELHEVVRRMLEKKPDARFQSMSELSNALLGTPEGMALQHEQPMSVMRPLSSIPPAPGHATAGQFDRVGKPTTAAPVVPKVSHTLEAATTSGEAAPKKSNAGVVFGGLAFMLVAGGVAAYFVVPRLGADGDYDAATAASELVNATALPTTSPEPPPTVAVTVANPAPLATPALTVVATAESPKVKVSIETTPPGAKVMKEGYQICESTPCEIQVDRDEPVELLASLGNKKGSYKLIAQQDQTVTIALKAPQKSPGSEEKLCEVPGPGGLKVFRKCN